METFLSLNEEMRYRIWDQLLWSVVAKVRVQVFKNELHMYIYLDYVIIEFLPCIEKIIFFST